MKAKSPDIAAQLRAIRKRTGMGIDRFAKHIGLRGGSTLQRYEDPSIDRTHLPVDLVQRLLTVVGTGTPPIEREEILTMAMPPFAEITPPPPPSSILIKGGVAMNVYGPTTDREGKITMAFNAVDLLPPPSDLLNVREAYGFIFPDESMTPAFDPGDVCWVNPHLPPRANTFGIFFHEESPDAHGRDRHQIVIRRLLGWTRKAWSVEQYNPSHKYTLSRDDWHTYNLIVGKKFS